MKRRTLTTVLTCAAILALNTACAESENEAPQPTEAAPVDEAAPAEAAQQLKLSEGMRIPVDGSSLEAFENSLETIRKEVTETEYTTLTNAIDYLLVYDLSARRNKEKLAANLDGLTGEEIIEKVRWSRHKPR